MSDKPSAQEKVTAPTAAAAVIQIDERRSGGWLRGLVWQTPSWLVSMVVHVVVLLVLALLTLPPPLLDEIRELVVAPGQDEALEEIDDFDEGPLEEIDFQVTDMVFEAQLEQEVIDVSPFDEMEAAAVSVELSDIGLEHAPNADLLSQVGAFSGNSLDGRGSGKARLVASGGGSEGSERAVALGLKWLAEHQLPDGGWSFN
ncbi:MAG: hypothetical protein ABIK89_04540, partial [Planctomycetota bacterium]